MRRALSIFLALIFGLGPLAATFQVRAESRLPACCRRHGAHHCTMDAEAAINPTLASPSSSPAFNSPVRCPYFPGNSVASATPVHALAASAEGLPTLLTQAHMPAAGRAAARLSQIRTRAGRAPPSSLLG